MSKLSQHSREHFEGLFEKIHSRIRMNPKFRKRMPLCKAIQQ